MKLKNLYTYTTNVSVLYTNVISCMFPIEIRDSPSNTTHGRTVKRKLKLEPSVMIPHNLPQRIHVCVGHRF